MDSQFEEISDGMINVKIDDEGDLSEIMKALDVVSVGTGSQEAVRVRRFIELVEDMGLWKLLFKQLNEMSYILRMKLIGSVDDIDEQRFKTVADMLGKGAGIRRGLVERMDEARLITLAQAIPRPRVAFKYVADGREVAFEKASEGQRAAALLMMLLRQKGGPLIIDQPEGDLDNRIISRIVYLAHLVKSNRQIIMVSHNANLVVNASAEQVILLDTDAGARCVKATGVIDSQVVRYAITLNTEGGEQAFRDRQRKYGF